MSRSVVFSGCPRCERCQMPFRWCICAGIREVQCPVKVDVLMHGREQWRPSSTGHLIRRVVPSAGVHVYRREKMPERTEIAQPGKTLWIMHPAGDPLPVDASPSEIQVLLLDGNWQQANEMMRRVGSWGRPVSLPMCGENRYWLRAEVGEGRYCTVEALIFLLAALGLDQAHTQLRLQFELHVYAGLCARGAKTRAAQYLATSALRHAMPELIDRLAEHRPLDPAHSRAGNPRTTT